MLFGQIRITFFFAWVLLLSGCASTPSLTAWVHRGSLWMVRLASITDANRGRGYSHPASVSAERMAGILRDLYIEPKSFVLSGDAGQDERYRVFTDDAADTLAPYLADGLMLADAQEIVTFVQTVPVSSRQERITSGGIFIADGNLHIVLANHRVKQAIWQDLETYQAPVYTQPLTPIAAQSGRLVFKSESSMPTVSESDFTEGWSDLFWHVAIRYRDLHEN